VPGICLPASRSLYLNGAPDDDIPHNVVSPEQKFKSPVLDTDEMFSHTFEVAGTYKYYCSIHPRMTGQIVVR
jgi:plastocyanin